MWALILAANVACLAYQIHDGNWAMASVAVVGTVISLVGLSKEM